MAVNAEECKQFYFLIEPQVEKIAFPTYFYRRFKNELGDKVYLTDYIGSWISIRVEKKFSKAYLTTGIRNIVDHFNRPDGCWVRMLYLGENKFYINIQDFNLRNILYPPSRTIDYESFVIPGIEEVNADDPDLNNVECRSKCEITLTARQARADKMHLPASFVREGLLDSKPTAISLVDKNGKEFKCTLNWGKRDCVVKLGKKWKKFCLNHNLKHGSCIVLGVDADVKIIHVRVKRQG